MNAVELSGIRKSYRLGATEVTVLRGVDLQVAQHEYVAVMGASGSGKSTLLNIIGFLDTPDAGEIRIHGRPVQRQDDAALSGFRNRTIGFVFQSFHLLGNCSALENVMLPLRYRGLARAAARTRASAALAEVGMERRAAHRPDELSGGERQRVAIARAIVGEPDIILADEPTGNLDSKTSDEVLDVFARIHANGRTLIVVTHAPHVAERCQRTIRVSDGRVLDAAAPATA
ncbi:MULTISPECIES: ABC transporter ATP-binding protein [unclassified Lysobacter]|uniref:ABC transporter ATP-binding protein n=1 Tax=unclassified Lysobacter TaxID=2635362 RepID=UPI001BE8FD85|nr:MULTISPECIES: ABC transporter ATP-binding protein [unclassified Lysobacter]MBT2747684.1 ABC transporter ATP-binding protein [Lysobacter sp. ISL-42]MBT2752835.1 ABC transporter ATP-binding protein [Lysobacter sp. ISL-50]MBT2779719.1 ABC transporter ATP-binding protein [Lysobacter sp. ISL-54]MBT2780102.1 ABC transporter ATP-binding protein [Lysobacter sp. ISL-52]